ncbi:phosphoribosylanthranilate isomerase [Acetobacteraceae bacterium KSS8]|uniref:N-(5'-phosphoribosyl)anthranilate isomerase n=1 Tax=Endosaccharibacter trunci TaxID=2812733 RepID=A0ABT1W5A4_9PROT|nr:phosphoribosylanthranilate isomerase [Acetobacteraceae bacterium KSS8]
MPAEIEPVRVKICGLSEPDTLDAAVAAGADWVGFVLFPRSPRYVSVERAAELRRRVPDTVGVVALLVKPGDAEIDAARAALPRAILQIYDDTSRCMAIRARVGAPVWQAIGVDRARDLPVESMLDGLVVESRPPAGADRPGGNGQGFDWRITAGWRAPAPWLLAGGLTPDNVAKAIRQSGARAVDVSSGAERASGQKDVELIAAFVRAARSAS